MRAMPSRVVLALVLAVLPFVGLVAATDQHVPVVAGLDRERLCTVAATRLLDGAPGVDAVEPEAPLVLLRGAA